MKYKKIIEKLCAVLLVSMLCVSFTACQFTFNSGEQSSSGANSSAIEENDSSESGTSDSSISREETETVLTVSSFAEPISLVDEGVTAYFEASDDTLLQTVLENYDNENKDKGKAVTLSYQLENIKNGVSIKSAEVQIFEKGETQAYKTVEFSQYKKNAEIYNLKTGMEYTFTVTVTLSDNSVLQEMGEFETADTVRLMNIKNIRNVRDIGSYKTADGKRIKQGLFYRGGELDGAGDGGFDSRVISEGKKEMLNTLGIKTDLDLRTQKNGMTAMLGSNVNHDFYNMVYYSSVFTSGTKTTRNVFEVLAQPSNYPIYAHCTYGMDRTGTVSFLLGALLGISESDLVRDYELTGLCDYLSGHNREKTDFVAFLKNFKALEGETLQDKAIGYLLGIGITQEQIDAILATFIGDGEAYKEELENAVLEDMAVGDTYELPYYPCVSYSTESDLIAIDGRTVTVSDNVSLTTAVLIEADLSFYGLENVTLSLNVLQGSSYIVSGIQKYELYKGLLAGKRVANTEAFAISTNVPVDMSEGFVWTLGEKVVTDYVSVSGDKVTLDVVGANVYGGVYELIGRASDDSSVIVINVVLVNRIITTAEDLLAWEKYGDKTNAATLNVVKNLRNPDNPNIAVWNGETGTHVKTNAYTVNGYFELGANIDLTDETVDAYSYFTANGDTRYGLNGVFDGCGYTVRGGTYIEGGLFGAISKNGVLKNIALIDVTLSTSSAYYYGLCPSAVAETVSGRMENVLVDVTNESWATSARGCATVTAVAEYIYGAEFENCVFYMPLVHEAGAIIAYTGMASSAINVYAIGCDSDSYRKITGTSGLFKAGYFLHKASEDVTFKGLDEEIWTVLEGEAVFKSSLVT